MVSRAFVPRSLDPEAGLGPRFFDRRRELLGLSLAALGVFFVLALASFRLDPEDPAGGGGDWMGLVGATLARVTVLSVGGAAWLIPIHLALLALHFFRTSEPREVGLRLAGDAILLLLLASLLQVAFPEGNCFGGAPAGGNVGLVFGELLRGLFSTPGSILVTATAALLIGIGRASFSMVAATQRLAAWARAFSVWLSERCRAMALAWKTAAAFRKEQALLLEPELSEGLENGNEQVFFHPELVGPWVPSERTGHPPLAVIEALRKPTTAEADADFWADALDDGQAHAARPCEPALRPSAAGRSWEIIDDEAPASAEIEQEGGEFAAEDLECSDEVDEDEVDDHEDEVDEVEPEPKIVARAKDAEPVRRLVRDRRATPHFELPNPALLEEPPASAARVDRSVFLAHATRLEATLADYGVLGKVEEIHPGPTVTTYEVSPSAGTKVSKVAGLADDLALGLSRKVRIVAPIPGKSRIGFELPNDRREPVYLKDLIEDARFLDLGKRAPLPVVLGRDIVGAPYYADLASMPHVIVAGATGAGKSVGLNVMLSSLLFMRTPEELRLLMIDPKVVELAPFDRIPHLLLPVVTDMKQAATALRWAVDEMERRYQIFADAGTKNIGTYNRYVERVIAGELPAKGAPTATALAPDGSVVDLPGAQVGQDGVSLPERLPYIVIVVDEFADLMMQQGKEVEASVARLAQKARAAGMHVILATQRPSVDVITGMIKANFPTRIAFRVAQKVDSRTILDEQGAEVLLGRGDMLVKMNGAPDTQRVQCPFISEEEVSALTDHLRAQAAPRYEDSILARADEAEEAEEEEKVDPRFEEAVLIVRDSQRCSTSWLQRKMTIGYNRAAKMVEMMEKRGYVGPPSGSKDREVLLPP